MKWSNDNTIHWPSNDWGREVEKKTNFISVLDPFEGSKAILQELSPNDSDYMFEYTGVSGDQFKRFV